MKRHRQKPLILNVDDDAGGRYAVTRDLQRWGYDVLDAGTGADAMARAAESLPDLVLLDVHLPDVDGFEVCRRLKADPVTAAIPVLHISASYVSNDARALGLNKGADGYLTEPVDPGVLHATVNSLLRMKEAEHKLREIAVQWQSTFDAISDGVAILDLNGNILRTNRAFDVLAGNAGAPARGLFTEFFPPDDGRDPVCEMFASGRREGVERSTGGRILRIVCDPILGEDQAALACVCIISDITENRRLEEQLRQAQKLESVGLLAGGVAHDFNNLLTGILGNASLALEAGPSHEISQLLTNVVNASERAADLARQLLAYAGKGKYVVQTADIAALVQDILPLIRAAIPRSVKLELDCDPDLPPVEADVSQLRQLIMNLVINGAEAIGDAPGAVRVAAGSRHMDAEAIRSGFFAAESVRSGVYVRLRVEDTGCGMDEETQARIFDPFFTTKFLGRGLGLAAALGIVRQHRGAIRLESAPGKGACFEVLLPASAGQLTKPITTKASAARGAGTILVIDDEEIVRTTVKAGLERLGYRVVLTGNGREGVEVFSRRPDDFTLVLLDLAMPEMGGEETLRKILATRAGAKVLVISGYDEADAMSRFGGARAAGFLQKPFTASRLAHKIRQVLRHSAAGSQG